MMGVTGLSIPLFWVLGNVGMSAIAQSTSPSIPSPTPVNLTNPTSRPVLRLGSEGEDVKQIQAMLALLGFYDGPISGRLGENTEAAVTRFQRAASLTADGIVGASTWNSLLPSAARVTTPPPPDQPAEQPTSPPAHSTIEAAAPQPRPAPSTAPDIHSSPSTDPAPSTDDETVPYVEFPVLRRGMRGAAVIGLQEKLNAIGVYNGPIDGIFGSQTEAAVIEAQRRLNLTQDGVVGSATWTAILDLTPQR